VPGGHADDVDGGILRGAEASLSVASRRRTLPRSGVSWDPSGFMGGGRMSALEEEHAASPSMARTVAKVDLVVVDFLRRSGERTATHFGAP